MKDQPKDIIICNLECVVMPNGDIICLGKNIGKFKDFKECLEIKDINNQ